MPARASLVPGPRSRSSRSAEAARSGPDGLPLPALTHSLAPLLDLAFGIEGEPAFPDEIAALVASLHAGPLGSGAAAPEDIERPYATPALEAA